MNDRIVKLEVENVKRLKAVSITPEGNLVVVGGRNAQGKSSVLDSIEYALKGGKSLPPRTLRDGTDRGYVVVETPNLVIKRSFTGSGNSSLVVCNRQNNLKLNSPQAILDKLAGELTFDPLAFSRMKAKDQADVLKKLMGLNFDELEARKQNLFAERTLINRDEKTAEANLSQAAKHDDAPLEEQSASDLAKELREKTEANNARANLEREVEGMDDEIHSMEDAISELKEELAQAENDLKQILSEKEEKSKLLGKSKVYDTTELESKLAQIDVLNSKYRDNQRYAQLEAALLDAHKKSEALTENLAEIDAEKADMLARAEMPIEGLAFDDSGVTLNGKPFCQCSSAEQLKVSIAMGIALAPELKIMLIRDGSLLDADSLKIVKEMAEQAGAQVWMERVSEGQEVSVVIEDGEVRE